MLILGRRDILDVSHLILQGRKKDVKKFDILADHLRVEEALGKEEYVYGLDAGWNTFTAAALGNLRKAHVGGVALLLSIENNAGMILEGARGTGALNTIYGYCTKSLISFQKDLIHEVGRLDDYVLVELDMAESRLYIDGPQAYLRRIVGPGKQNIRAFKDLLDKFLIPLEIKIEGSAGTSALYL